MAAVGPDCFDCAFYQEVNADLAALSCWQAFTHFINYGQFEMRSHRCASCMLEHGCNSSQPAWRCGELAWSGCVGANSACPGCRFSCDTSLTDKAVPYMPAEEGQPWPRLTTAGCSSTAAAGGAEAGGEDLRAQVEQYRQEVEALREEIAALTDVSLPGDGASNGSE